MISNCIPFDGIFHQNYSTETPVMNHNRSLVYPQTNELYLLSNCRFLIRIALLSARSAWTAISFDFKFARMKLIIVLSLCALAAAYPSDVQRKSPMEQGRYEKLLSMLYRKANLEVDVLRGGRIVGGYWQSGFPLLLKVLTGHITDNLRGRVNFHTKSTDTLMTLGSAEAR